ncbi:MAG: S46 family peptidase [Myxococcota bacterium]
MRRSLLPRLAVLFVASQAAHADEGMWTLDNFPAAAVEKAHGVHVSQAWLDRVRGATVRLSVGCTGSFISRDGLILTNHHCVESCLDNLSTRDVSLNDDGFVASSRAQERVCPGEYADVLVATEDVSARVARALVGLDDRAANDARKRTLTELEQRCEEANAKTGLKCEAVTLYQGGQYFLYQYRRYGELRIAFAPEIDVASFGGDPDNFQFPRWSVDAGIVRAYENGKPARTPEHLSVDFAGPDVGETVFVSGHPGSTSRLLTLAELRFERDVLLPGGLLRAAELRGRLIQFSKGGAEQTRIASAMLNGLENGLKVRRKLLDALHDETQLAAKARAEAALQASYTGAGHPWDDAATAMERQREIFLPYLFLEVGVGFNSEQFRFARTLVRAAEERAKPNGERLREYAEAALPQLEQQVLAPIPIYPELERLTLTFGLERLREWLGPDHAVVRRLLSKESPDALAERLVLGSKLGDVAVRKPLWEGGSAAIAASSDPMLALARALDADARAVRKRYEDEVEAPQLVAAERIAAARFESLGTGVYPDATFTLRLNPGTVRAWRENGVELEPFTRLGRLFERATGARPFLVPERWRRVQSQLDPNTPVCISTDNDIVGGNSGSPLVDARGRLVGLLFDGNIHSISGDYWFDAERNRAIAVHPAILRVALAQVYGANALLREIEAE